MPARHKKPRRKPLAKSQSQPGSRPGAPADWQARAAQALGAKHYKEAINLCKQWLKALAQTNGQRPLSADESAACLSFLADAYHGRAAELAGKGLFREALAIEQHRAERCGGPEVTQYSVLWLLQAGDPAAAAEHYRQLCSSAPRQDCLPACRENLAAFALAGQPVILEHLPADDPVVTDHPHAIRLLQSIDNDDDAFQAAMKGIAWRSPYRHFRQLASALRQRCSAPDKAAAMLRRIPAHSPFQVLASRLVNGLESSLSAGRPSAGRPSSALLLLRPEALNVAASLHQWDAQQVALLKSIQALGPEPDARGLFNVLIRHADPLDTASARRTALHLLVHFPQGDKAFQKAFGAQTNHEACHLSALRAEQNRDDPEELEDRWLDLIVALAAEADTADNRLRAALVHRYLVTLAQRSSYDDSLSPDVVEHLDEGLRLDPDDQQAWVDAIRLLRTNELLKQARSQLGQALKRFPDDVNILLEAVQTAIASQAFKKATGHAKRLLEIDPINIPVQGLLLEAHVAHARKQLAGGKLDLARHELTTAENWARSEPARGSVRMLQGMLEYLDGNVAAALELWQQAVELLGGTLVGRFHWNLELIRLRLAPDQVARKVGRRKLKLESAGQPLKKCANRQTVVQLVRALGSITHIKGENLRAAVEPLLDVLKRAAKQPYSAQEFELILDAWQRHRMYALQKPFARVALQRFPDKPLFVFHYVFGKVNGMANRLGLDDYEQIEQAGELAHRQGDTRAVVRIMEFMQPVFGGMGPMPDDFDMPGRPPPEMEEAFEQILEILGPRALEEFLKALDNDDPDAVSGQLEALGDAKARSGSAPSLPRGGGRKKKGKGGAGTRAKGKQASGETRDNTSQWDLFE